MAKNREGSINLFGAVQAKTEDGIVAHADGIAVEYDENGKPTKTLAQAIEDGSLGGGNSTDKPTNRPVPNTGYVEKVYFNTNLSVEEVKNMLSVLPFNGNTPEVLLMSSSMSKIIMTHTLGEGYAIFDEQEQFLWLDEAAFEVVKESEEISHSGWQDFTNPIEINEEVLSESDALGFSALIGSDNHKLTSLISIDPFSNSSPLEVIDVKELPPVTIDTSTAVPSSGYIEKVYFNTKLSSDDYYKLLSNITWIDSTTIGQSGFSFYPVLSYINNSIPYVLGFIKYAEDNIHFGLIDFSTMMTVQNFFIGEWETFENPYPIGFEALTELSGISIGTQNDKLISLASTTPFDAPTPDIQLDKLYRTPITDGYKYNQFVNGEWKELSYNGIETKELKEKPLNPVAIPNNGLLSQVYVNTSLSYDEVLAILDEIPYFDVENSQDTQGYYVFGSSNFKKRIECAKISSDGVIMRAIGYMNYADNESGSTTVIWCDENYANAVNSLLGTTYKVGWQDFANPLTFGNITIVDTDKNGNPVGNYNSELTNLFSLNPYLTDIDTEKIYKLPITKTLKGTLVPNEGTVDKIYFNTNLTAKEVHNIFNTLPFMQTPLLQYPLYPVLFSATGSPIIMVVKAENTYEITIVKDLSTSDFEYAYLGDSTLGTGNWILSEYEINSELISEYMGLPVGTSNSQLRNLISTAPFKTKKVGNEFYHLLDGQMVKLGLGKEEIKDIIAEYMEANYDNFDEEEF